MVRSNRYPEIQRENGLRNGRFDRFTHLRYSRAVIRARSSVSPRASTYVKFEPIPSGFDGYSTKQLRTHYKNMRETAAAVSGMSAAKAVRYLKDVEEHKQCVPFRRRGFHA